MSPEFWVLRVSSGSSSQDLLVILKKVEIINFSHSHFEIKPIPGVTKWYNITPVLLFIPSGYGYNSYCYNYLKGGYRQVRSQSFLPDSMR